MVEINKKTRKCKVIIFIVKLCNCNNFISLFKLKNRLIMPREIIIIQAGQTGNQIGWCFWDLVLREHAEFSKKKKQNCFDDAMSSFFRNFDSNGSNQHELKPNNKLCPIGSLKARAILVDLEEGVINQLLKSDIGELFENTHLIADVSGAGNNWAHGHIYYGKLYKEKVLEKIKKAVEACDSLQSFIIIHSLGGGTGSGFGTFILKLLEEYYPSVFRFTVSIFPSKSDDVITSPYNSMFSLRVLYEYADCVFPVDNEALINICNAAEDPLTKHQLKQPNILTTDKDIVTVKVKGSNLVEGGKGSARSKPFDKMNNIVAHLLSNLTSSMRFEGKLNIDLNEITMNLVPYPKLHFLLSSMAPLYTLSDVRMLPRNLDQSFKDILSNDHQLITSNPLSGRYLAIGLFLRGDIAISDVSRNIDKIKKEVDMIYWNKEGFKYGICDVAPVGHQRSILCLANNTNICGIFQRLQDNYMALFRHKLYTHHYTQYDLELTYFEETLETIKGLIGDYKSYDIVQEPEYIKRFSPLF